MSTGAQPQPQSPPPSQPQRERSREVRIISHSNLFYWWPVWAAGYICALITYFSGWYMASVPEGTEPRNNIQVKVGNTFEDREGLLVPLGRGHLPKDKDGNLLKPHLLISNEHNVGVLYCTILLLVIFITNIHMRGLWSVIVIGIIVFMSIIFAYAGAWKYILEQLSFLDIRINLGGYMFLSTVLLIIWLVVFFFFDKQVYMIFTPGQLRVRLEIGEGETAYDTMGMTVQKQRSDLFRHWILGLGSGDLVVKTSGAHMHEFNLPNVLFLGRKIREVEEMLRSRPVFTA